MPGAIEHRTWEPGESIDWPEGAFALETATGRVQGYRLGLQHTNDRWHEAVDYRIMSRAWIGARITERQRGDSPPAYARRSYILLDRESLQSWRWPADELDLEAVSDDHILLRDVRDGLYTLMTREGEVRAQFSLPGAADEYSQLHSFFSPDGQTLVISVDSPGPSGVYRMPVAAQRPEVLFEAQPDRSGRTASVRADESDRPWYAVRYVRPGAIRVQVNYGHESHYFDWDGNPLPAPSYSPCGGDPSPDGRYVAQQRGFALGHKYHGHIPEDTGPWPLVVILDAESCEPLLRVLSAYTYQRLWQAEWLSNSSGYVVGLADGYAIARVDPEPGLTHLPAARTNVSATHDVSERTPGPVPAPDGGGRYFSYEFRGVYDADEGEWRRVDFMSRWPDTDVRWEFTSWGVTHEEVEYQTGQWGPLSSWDGWFGGHFEWYLLQPKIELPPFPDELSFIVADTGGCLDILEPTSDFGLPDASAVAGCLPDGTRVSLAALPGFAFNPQRHLTSAWSPTLDMWAQWAHVRSEDGFEGWIPIDHLRHE